MNMTNQNEGTFDYDLEFLNQHQPPIILSASDDPNAQAAIVAGYQGRVMTSTSNGKAGNSYGWINYDLIRSGVRQPHMNAFGGEERFWLSPEGGQFSVFFKKGDSFDFANWQTPAVIDSLPYNVIRLDSSSVSFSINTEVENYSGTLFHVEINRKVSMMDKVDIRSSLNISSLGSCTSVAYESVNEITNIGSDWNSKTGMLGIWLLGMFKPTDRTVIIAPYTQLYSAELLLTDDYFGVIPSDRIAVKDSVVLLKADGKYRSKIGLAPNSAKNVAGSYDAENGILTIIQYDLKRDERYLKSSWEIHSEPYSGDVLNAYNDGKLDDGSQMGPFYELESSSATRALRKGEKLTHCQRTYHFEGDAKALSEIAFQVLGVKLNELEDCFI
jgi:hypothetical protein